ncbi:hypothetical protein Cgig2_015937 [Carnegiea gigantea]|uniref:CCHC-type domain-containing protein n=1 Tax=Carnegiea gigantea TaxID=171969 RepID=A0A9Q1KNV5_9CARY|nr:hypothetical protein Cgig2_015937 [Carnegiea gigantea]
MKGKAKLDCNEEEGDDSNQNATRDFAADNSDDDDVGNEDLSLEIVQKAMARASQAAGGDAGTSDVAAGEDAVAGEPVASKTVKKKVVKKVVKVVKKKKKVKKPHSETGTERVTMAKEEETLGITENAEMVKMAETDDGDNSDNVILRRLLRGPRYFDPPDKSWGACFNCGEEGHSAVNCTLAKRKKPCFICGSLEHEAKQCQKDCFICKGGGHRAKDCPKKFKKCSQGSELCLKCGASAHAMSFCNNDYSPDDLKVNKRNRDTSTPTGRHPKENKGRKGLKSAPQDLGKAKANKKKKLQLDNGSPDWSSKSKGRGGWITDDPGDVPREKKWRSPSTPNAKHKIYSLTNASDDSSSQSCKKWNKFSSGMSSSQGYAKRNQSFSASRFGNSRSDGTRGNYDWW